MKMASNYWPAQWEPGFHRFPELPPELQLLIWTFAIPEPRIINYSTNYYPSHREGLGQQIVRLHNLSAPYPGILGACYDSRVEALKRYQWAFSAEFGRYIFVDFERDCLELGDLASLQAFSIKNTPFAGSKMEGDNFKMVAITLNKVLEPPEFKLLCSNFAGMRTLNVREDNWAPSIQDGQPLSEFAGEEIENIWPWLTSRIRRNIEARGGNWTSWRPPKVVRGTAGQWRYTLQKERELVMNWIRRNDVDFKAPISV